MTRWVSKYWTVCRVGLLVLWVRILLRFLSLPTVLSLLEPQPGLTEGAHTPVEDLVHYVDRWLLLFPYNTKGSCFPRSVVLYRGARQAGLPVRLHCGVRREGGTLDGHAWLTLDGHPFQEPSRQWQQYTVTFSYPFDPYREKAIEKPAHG